MTRTHRPEFADEHDEQRERGEQGEKEQREEQEVEEKSATGPHIVYKAIMKEGEEELERSTSALAWSGLAAGLSMGFSLVTEGLLRAHLAESEWRPLLAKFGYTIGFLIVVLGRQQLFTENTLTAVLPVLKEKSADKFFNMGRLWGIVLLTNLVGAATFAYVLARTPVFDQKFKDAFLAIGQEAMRPSFGVLLLRGIFAGWLIALMVWLMPVAETARVWVIIIITWLVGVAQLSHIIAGSIETIYVVAAGEASWMDYLGHYLVPTLAGNIIGGTSLVAALNHAQVVSGGGASVGQHKGSALQSRCGLG